MPNNFKLSGERYFSKAGHDSNDGLTKDTPKKSLTAPTIYNANYIYGSGVYTGNLAITLQTSTSDLSNPSRIVGDGKVIFDFLGIYSFSQISGGVSYIKYDNIHFRNAMSATLSGNAITMQAANCMFESFPFIYNHSQFDSSFEKCIFINSSKTGTNTANITNAQKSIYISTTWIGFSVIKDCYFDVSSSISYSTNPSGTVISNFRNNNIRGIIKIGGLKYAIKDLYGGTPQDAGYSSDVYWLTEANLTANGYTGTITGWNAAVATCINREPSFNDASKMDFTLKSDSPHIGRAFDGVANIGGTSYAQSFYAGISNPNILMISPSDQIDTMTNSDWKLVTGQVEGTIRMIIKVANTSEVITSIPYVGNKAFNSDSTPGANTNFNVPDSKPTTSAYPSYLSATSTASDAYRVVIANHGFTAGVWLKVDGQYREVTSVNTNELFFLTAVRAAVTAGSAVQLGNFSALTSLNPNRLNFVMRSSVLSVVDSSNWDNPSTWDNNSLADAGTYLEQEWDRQPMIDNLHRVGYGDDSYDSNYGNPIQVKYIDLIIYLRNNYKS